MNQADITGEIWKKRFLVVVLLVVMYFIPTAVHVATHGWTSRAFSVSPDWFSLLLMWVIVVCGFVRSVYFLKVEDEKIELATVLGNRRLKIARIVSVYKTQNPRTENLEFAIYLWCKFPLNVFIVKNGSDFETVGERMCQFESGSDGHQPGHYSPVSSTKVSLGMCGIWSCALALLWVSIQWLVLG